MLNYILKPGSGKKYNTEVFRNNSVFPGIKTRFITAEKEIAR